LNLTRRKQDQSQHHQRRKYAKPIPTCRLHGRLDRNCLKMLRS